jgi:redox-regulated HSP33 family molecular chaperone
MVLKTLPEAELLSVLEDGKLTIHCEFCNTKEIFTRADVNRLYRKPAKAQKRS